MQAFLYPISLAIISALVAALEALFPHRKTQPQLRKRLWSDLLHLIFNGHFLGVILYGLAVTHVLPWVDARLTQLGWIDAVYRNAAQSWPVWLQIVVALVVVDFIQWGVHNLLHRTPLWELHKTHHSVKDGEMDWIVSFRFQWTEVVVYKSILYLPLAFFGFGYEAVMFHAIFGTLIGHLNHANLDWDWGPLKYVLNSPNMHIWHHDYDGDSRTTVNFGIIFSTWDWIFGTAKLPDHPPARIGFDGVEQYPDDFFSQTVWPLQRWLPALRARQLLGAALGVALLGAGWYFHVPRGPRTHTPMFGEPVAASQPTTGAKAHASAYSADHASLDAALERLGQDARAEGFAHPEAMVSARELAAALGHPRLVVLDVRPRERFLEGHVPTARQLYRGDYSSSAPTPGLSLPPDALRALLGRLGVAPDAVVVAYTDGGPEAWRLWWTLREVVGVEIRLLDGGLQRWKAEGHGLAMGDGLPINPSDRPPLSLQERYKPAWGDVKTFMEAHPDALLLDTRGADEFSGQTQHRNAARKGHIPGAKHMDWYTIVRDTAQDHRLLPPDALRALMARHGVTPQRPVVAYCQSGTRSAATAFALYQLGHRDELVLNYDGSWAEYSRTDLPVE